jgi:hypothetical protein
MGAIKLAHVPMVVDGLRHAGIPESAVTPIALLELACAALYVIPRTMVLGAVLLTGFLGGAIVVHVIGNKSVPGLILIGLWVWGGIYFRVPALQALLPLRKEDAVERNIGTASASGAVSKSNATAS